MLPGCLIFLLKRLLNFFLILCVYICCSRRLALLCGLVCSSLDELVVISDKDLVLYGQAFKKLDSRFVYSLALQKSSLYMVCQSARNRTSFNYTVNLS